MIKYLVDSGERRDIVLLYSNYREEEIVFKDVLCDAEKKAGVKVVHTLTDGARIGPAMERPHGVHGCRDDQAGGARISDRATSSCRGPPGMVNTMKKVLRTVGVPRRHVRSDYFPGYST